MPLLPFVVMCDANKRSVIEAEAAILVVGGKGGCSFRMHRDAERRRRENEAEACDRCWGKDGHF